MAENLLADWQPPLIIYLIALIIALILCFLGLPIAPCATCGSKILITYIAWIQFYLLFFNLPHHTPSFISFQDRFLAFDIFSTESDIDCIMDRLSQLFLMNTLVVRKGRKVDRHKISDVRSLNYQKRARKHVF